MEMCAEIFKNVQLGAPLLFGVKEYPTHIQSLVSIFPK